MAACAALAFTAWQVWRRWRWLDGGEIVIYWIGGSLAATTAVASWAHLVSLTWPGIDPHYNGLCLGAIIPLIAAAVIAVVRRDDQEPTETAFYWAGCSLALAIALAAYFVSPSAGQFRGLLIAAILSSAWALRLILRSDRLSRTASFIYWAGTSVAAAVTFVIVLDRMGVYIALRGPTDFLALPLFLVINGLIAIIIWRSRK